MGERSWGNVNDHKGLRVGGGEREREREGPIMIPKVVACRDGRAFLAF